ncbi:MAG TPA: glycine zipper family protein [Polyangiaceae bacterium]|nr:glycine zipper family protein [Polyangiaceae bacterium]
MDEFLAITLAPPTVAFTALLALMLVYWVFVMVGALDLDLFDPGGTAEGVDGAGEAAEGGLAGVLSALRLRHAPVTVVLSFVALFGWLGSYFGMRHLAPLLPVPGVLSGLLVALAAAIVALPLTSLVTRPLAPLFRTAHARGNADLIGKVVTVKTGRVDARFGQGTLEDGLLLHVRCEDPDALARGDRALIVAWDEEKEVFEVEPLEAVMGNEKRRRAE